MLTKMLYNTMIQNNKLPISNYDRFYTYIKENSHGKGNDFRIELPKHDGKWKKTCKRYVAFLDIMGFKDLVAREKHSDVLLMMQEITNKIKTLINVEHGKIDGIFLSDSVKAVNFSDSIIIFSKNDSIHSYLDFLKTTGKIFAEIMIESLPIKGAIAFGEITADFENALYIGQPIIDAFLLEEEVKYYGIAIHHSVESAGLINENFAFSDKMLEIISPLKTGNIEHYNLCWFYYALEKIVDNIEISKEGSLKELYKIVDRYKTNVSGSPRKYIDNTKIVIKSFVDKFTKSSIQEKKFYSDIAKFTR